MELAKLVDVGGDHRCDRDRQEAPATPHPPTRQRLARALKVKPEDLFSSGERRGTVDGSTSERRIRAAVLFAVPRPPRRVSTGYGPRARSALTSHARIRRQA